MTRLNTLVLALLVASPATTMAVELQPFTAHYKVEVSGLGGELVSALNDAGDGRYVFENRTRARGIARLARPRDVVDRSEFRLDDGQIRPLSFESTDGTRKNKRGNEIVFDWREGSARSDYRDEQREIDLDGGILDRQLMQLAMMSDLASGVRSAQYTVIDRHDVKTYEIQVLGDEHISVPAGEYDTVKVRRQRSGSSRATIMWCVPQLNYLPVLTQQLKEDKVIATLSLTGLE